MLTNNQIEQSEQLTEEYGERETYFGVITGQINSKQENMCGCSLGATPTFICDHVSISSKE